jgi:dipeptidyl-peptidase 4
MKLYAFAAACLLSLVGLAQQKSISNAELLKNQIPNNFYAPLPSVIKWLNDEQVVLNTKIHPDSATKQYIMDVKSGNLSLYTAATPLKPEKQLIQKRGDLFVIINNEEIRLTQDEFEEKNPSFSPDSSKVAYTKNNNLYCYDLNQRKEIQLTADGTKTILNGYASWVYWEEIFGRSTAFRAYWWSPNSQTIAYMRFDESMVPMFPIYFADGQHGYIEETRYPKAGDKNPEVKIGFVAATGGTTTWANFDEKNDQYFGWPKFNPSGSSLYVQWLNRGQDSLVIFAVNPSTGSKQPIYTETQKTWIELDKANERITFLSNGKEMLIQSDKTGWNQLYLYTADGVLKNNVTQGNFTVKSIISIDEKSRHGVLSSTWIGKYGPTRCLQCKTKW